MSIYRLIRSMSGIPHFSNTPETGGRKFSSVFTLNLSSQISALQNKDASLVKVTADKEIRRRSFWDTASLNTLCIIAALSDSLKVCFIDQRKPSCWNNEGIKKAKKPASATSVFLLQCAISTSGCFMSVFVEKHEHKEPLLFRSIVKKQSDLVQITKVTLVWWFKNKKCFILWTPLMHLYHDTIL